MYHLNTDLILEISKYSLRTKIMLLNTQFYHMVRSMTRRDNQFWRLKYEEYFNSLDLNFLILKDSNICKYIWREELSRVIKFDKWYLFKGSLTKKMLDLSSMNLKEIPKEISNLVDLEKLIIDACHLSNIPKELYNLTKLHHITIPGQYIRMNTTATGATGAIGPTGASLT